MLHFAPMDTFGGYTRVFRLEGEKERKHRWRAENLLVAQLLRVLRNIFAKIWC